MLEQDPQAKLMQAIREEREAAAGRGEVERVAALDALLVCPRCTYAHAKRMDALGADQDLGPWRPFEEMVDFEYCQRVFDSEQSVAAHEAFEQIEAHIYGAWPEDDPPARVRRVSPVCRLRLPRARARRRRVVRRRTAASSRDGPDPPGGEPDLAGRGAA